LDAGVASFTTGPVAATITAVTERSVGAVFWIGAVGKERQDILTVKPLLRVLAGEIVWPPPIWLMRQAGRYLPEYREIRARAGDFIALCTAPELAAEVTLQPIRRYGFDAAILFSDILMVPWGLGHGLRFSEGEGPVLPKLRDKAAVDALDIGRMTQEIAPILETIRRVRAGLAAEGFDRTTLIGFAGSPFTVACYMVEGGGSKDFAAIRHMAYADPMLFGRLMNLLTDATIHYLAAQIEAGAETVMLFDSWAGVLSPSLFRNHVIAPTRHIVCKLRERYPTIPIIGFPRLAGTMLAEYAVATGIDAVGIDTATDPAQAAKKMPGHIAIQGNLDPMALLAGGEALAGEVRSVLTAVRGRPAIFNLGHGIVPQTPPEHVTRLVELVRAA
jgi:uroporphyrinogen decarboxylase